MPYLIALIFGLMAAFGALLVELLYTSFTVSTASLAEGAQIFTPTLFNLFVLAGIEELSKIIFFLRSTRFIKTPYQIFSFALCFGIGFTSLEYFAASSLDLPMSTSIFGILAIHIMSSLLMVFLLKSHSDKRQILITLILLTLLHFGYNASL